MHSSSPRLVAWLTAIVAALVVAAVPASAAQDNSYSIHLLTSDFGVAPNPDPNLQNAWGLTSGPSTPWWVSDNGTDKSTLYTADGTPQSRVVNVPSAPTGDVFWSLTAPAIFVFATEDGQIRGWHPPSNDTFVLADGTGRAASYKGLAISPTGDRFYATNFHSQRVEVFDSSTNPLTLVQNSGFVDPSIPSDYAPFGIQVIGSRVFVTYAKKESPDAGDELHGQGLGFVDAYDLNGNLLARVAQHGQLNAPWGLAWAPSNFGRFSGDLLVGNFGDGQINAYEELPSGQFVHRGELRTSDGKSLSIDGLWALQFGHGATANGPTNTLFFTAGPADESEGLFGSITS
jgi:uncharacterized protein (TIGR03118 family)